MDIKNKSNFLWYDSFWRDYQQAYNSYVANGRKTIDYMKFAQSWKNLIDLVANTEPVMDYNI